MIRNPRRAPHVQQRPAGGMPPGGWAPGDLDLPVSWYEVLSKTRTGCEYPVSGDRQANKDAGK